jgi:pantothenate kinase
LAGHHRGKQSVHDEGGWQRVRPLLDEVWYLDLPDDERRRRLVARRLSHGHPEDEARAWVAAVDEPNAVLFGVVAFAPAS